MTYSEIYKFFNFEMTKLTTKKNHVHKKLEYWLNIPYLPRLLRLGDDTCQNFIGWIIIISI